MCDVNNILKWNIAIEASDELMRILLENSKKKSNLRHNSKNVDTLNENEYFEENFNTVNFTKKELLILKKLENKPKLEHKINSSSCHLKLENKNKFVPKNFQGLKSQNLQLSHVKWFHTILAINMYGKGVKYLHDILLTCAIVLPTNIVERNPVLEARCQKLRAKQENEQYMKMTKNVDSSRSTHPEDTISYQVKSINKQLIAVLQFIFSVAAGFAFGFIGIELIIGNMDFGFRLLLGIICALIIALAEMYFLAKKLNEMDKISTDHNLEKKNQ